MDEDLAAIEVRLSVLEMLVAFQFAAQHMQTSDPAGAIRRLRSLLLERMEAGASAGDGRQDAISAAMERAIQRIDDLQGQLPRRLVD
jgi:hypothetical protein